MLFAGWEVNIVKNCDRGLKMLPRGRGQQLQAHSFSLYGPTLGRTITFLSFSIVVNWLTSGFVYATLSNHS